MRGRWAALAVLAAAVSVVPFAVATPPPSSIVALGGGASAGRYSWSTSSDSAVRSFRIRYERLTKLSRLRAYTFVTAAFSIADLDGQARLAVARAPGAYVTVELGVRDLCSGTPIETFQAGLDRALRVLSKVGRASGILVLSTPDLAREWRVLRANPTSAKALRSGRHFACGLGYSVTKARLAQVRARTMALNEAIARVCFRNRDCLYDHGTRFRMPLRSSYFSPNDYQRLSKAGERAVAAAEWRPALLLLRATG